LAGGNWFFSYVPKALGERNKNPAVLILSEPGGVFTGSGEFIRRPETMPREARVNESGD